MEESIITNEEVKKLEIEAVKLAESIDPPSPSSLLSALNLINDAIGLTETYHDDSGLASLLNNKAQIFRLLGRDTEALDCLNGLLSEKISKSNKVVRQASAQRGWLHFRLGDLEAAFRILKEPANWGA